MALVTRASLTELLNGSNPAKVQAVVGRALVILLKNQTADEQVMNATTEDNGIGFTGADARAGSITAKYWIKNQRLEDWMVDNWTRHNVNGVARLAKYHGQLNTAAMAKAKPAVTFVRLACSNGIVNG